MLVRMWGKGSPHSLLMGLETSAAILEINVENRPKANRKSVI